MAVITLSNRFKDRYGLGKEIMSFIQKLTADPSNPSLHIEPIKAAQDKRVRTGRINSKYRAVLFEIQGANDQHFVLLDVLNHDDAYALATKVRMRTNPVTGVTEVLTVSDAPSKAEMEAEIEARARAYAAEELARQQVEQQQDAAEAAEAVVESEPVPTEAPVEAPVEAPPTPAPAETLSAFGISSEQLLDELGISPVAVEIVSTARSEAELEALLAGSPAWEHDAVIGLLAGLSIAEVRADLGLEHVGASESAADEDTQLIQGLQTPAAAMDFAYDANEDELEAIISQMSMDQWRVFLHPSQEKAVRAEHSGSARIVGGAGTGKTVVVVHRTNHLLSSGDRVPRVLLTTFTRDLANSLKSQMNLLNPSFQEASTHGAPGLWISGIDALVKRVIDNAQPAEVAAAVASEIGGNSFPAASAAASSAPSALDPRLERQLWDEAVTLAGEALPPTKAHHEFLSQEYSAVILTHAIRDEKAYLRVSRAGRGTPLNRAERKALWATVQAFHSKCAAEGRFTFPMLAVIAAEIVAHRGSAGIFDHILIDEAQDFHAGHWRFLRACVAPGPNDIFLAEDSHQRIYGQRLTLEHFGITTRGRATNRLRVNYRTTAHNLRYASAILEGVEWIDSEGERDTLHGYRSLRPGTRPIFIHPPTKQEEAELLAAQIRKWAQKPNVSIGILTRTRKRREEVVAQLGELGIDVNEKHDANSAAHSRVTVMTMHNAKGLEFTHVALLDLGAKVLPQRFLLAGLAEAEQQDILQRERALLYVAASRARDGLLVSILGEPSELLPKEG